MVNTFYDSYRILMHIYSDKTFIKQAINSENIEPLNKNAVIKICYGVVERDIELEYYIKNLCEKRPKLPIRILLKIAIYNIEHLKKAPYAVTDSAVELCKKLGKGGMSGFLNAILRKYIKLSPLKLPENKISRLSVKYCYPEIFIKDLICDYGEENAINIMKYNDIHSFLRFKKGINGSDYLTEHNVNYEKTVFDNCFSVKNFVRDEGFFNGIYTFQSIGSVAICNIVVKGDKLLDCCSAPGGKSIYLSEKFNEVIATELHPHRVQLINSYKDRMGANNVIAKTMDATLYNQEFKENFDTVLCDSPCSGAGVLIENPDIKLNRTEKDINDLNQTQLKILLNVCNYVKKGGCLYYSTCSILKRENDDIIQKFLNEHKDFHVENINSPLNHLKMKYGLQFTPDLSFGAGFYICKMKRL